VSAPEAPVPDSSNAPGELQSASPDTGDSEGS
jgi:hypothetical protein